MKVDKDHGNNITAYPKAEKSLQDRLMDATVDISSFKQKLSRCSLAKCQGMCCDDGVYVEQETAETIQKVSEENQDFFKDIGLELPEPVIVQGEWKGLASGLKTATKKRNFSFTIQDYPTHFEDTACVFLTKEGRCGLQVFAEFTGLHPWYYKPFTCWMHPISITTNEDKTANIIIHNDTTDPCKLKDYDGFVTRTLCGEITQNGQSAYITLHSELTFLSEIVGRDFLKEIPTAPLENHSVTKAKG